MQVAADIACIWAPKRSNLRLSFEIYMKGVAVSEEQWVQGTDGLAPGLFPTRSLEQGADEPNAQSGDELLVKWLDQLRDAERRAERESSGIRLR